MLSSEMSDLLRKTRKFVPVFSRPVRARAEELLPHRGSMLLIDEVRGQSDDRTALRAVRRVAVDDPVFAGHFPGAPVYPGVLLVEAVAQAGVCLVVLNSLEDVVPPEGAIKARALKVNYAEFTAEVAPGDILEIDVFLANPGAIVAAVGGRISVGERICATAVVTIYVDRK